MGGFQQHHGATSGKSEGARRICIASGSGAQAREFKVRFLMGRFQRMLLLFAVISETFSLHLLVPFQHAVRE
jgi:hypothetical protein